MIKNKRKNKYKLIIEINDMHINNMVNKNKKNKDNFINVKYISFVQLYLACLMNIFGY